MLRFKLKNIFIPKTPYATVIFILINTIFYFYICTQSGFSLEKLIQGPGYDSLILFGAKENGLISIGQIHRFFFPFSCMLIWCISL